MQLKANLTSRASAAALHLGISLLIAALAALLVFKVWYPYPFSEISGGRELFLLLVTVDVILGPLLTFAVFNRAKSRRALALDLGIIGLLQMLALLYGLWTVFVARPVYLVHEVDRFQVVTAADVEDEALKEALPEFRSLPRFGWRMIGVRKARDSEEMLKSIEQAMAGKDVAMRPAWWLPLNDEHRAILQQRGKSIAAIRAKGASAGAALDAVLAATGQREEDVMVFPLVARKPGWAILLHRKTYGVVGYAPVDAF